VEIAETLRKNRRRKTMTTVDYWRELLKIAIKEDGEDSLVAKQLKGDIYRAEIDGDLLRASASLLPRCDRRRRNWFAK
jgi:hypothetical protein